MRVESRGPAAISILIVLNVTNEAGVLLQSGLSGDGEVGMPVQYCSLWRKVDEMVLLSVNWVVSRFSRVVVLSSYEYTDMTSSSSSSSSPQS